MNILSLRFSKAFKTYEEWAIPQRRSAQLLQNLIKVSGRTLDVGCGTGFASLGIEHAVGLDISKKMARVYKDRFGKVVVGDAESIPFKDRSFELVVSNFSLHWTDIRKSIPEALRVCSRQFVLALPVEGSLPHFGFPFPKREDIITLVERTDASLEACFIQNLEIPFKGWELVKFFHYTGSSYNPAHKGSIILRRTIENMISKVETSFFHVLFLSCEVKR